MFRYFSLLCTAMLPRPTLEAFDAWLHARSLRFEAVIVGGSALALLGVTTRQTRDVDVLDPEIGEPVLAAARDFAVHMRADGIDLADCVALAPTPDELSHAEPWLAQQDANPRWPDHVRATLNDVRRRLHHAL